MKIVTEVKTFIKPGNATYAGVIDAIAGALKGFPEEDAAFALWALGMEETAPEFYQAGLTVFEHSQAKPFKSTVKIALTFGEKPEPTKDEAPIPEENKDAAPKPTHNADAPKGRSR